MSAVPLFIPLKTRYFEAFKRGDKTIEYRRHDRVWHARNCYPGRRVILSHGYSGGQGRLLGIIVRFETRIMDSEIYGPGQELACIHIRLIDATD